ncbi:MAG: hypothetical protein PVF68_14210 [Acidobacteriota bacterium]|jgi:hypothetical protein
MRILLFVGAAAFLLAGPATPRETVPEPGFPSLGLVRVRAETLVLGGGGTHTVGRDEAILAPGKTGVLRLEVPLDGARETVSLLLQVGYETLPIQETDLPGKDYAAARLRITSTARALGSGETVMRSGGGELERAGSLFHEAFVSPESGERVVVNLDVAPWVPEAPPLVPRVEAAPRPVHYRVSVFRRDADGLEFLGTPVLHSLVGRAVSYGFGFTLAPRPGGAEAHEELRLEVRSVDLSEGQLSGLVTVSGVLRETAVESSAGWALENGQETRLTLELGEVAGEPVGVVLALSARF